MWHRSLPLLENEHGKGTLILQAEVSGLIYCNLRET
jgi:hypothetical protein